jgi:hypothetical protein
VDTAKAFLALAVILASPASAGIRAWRAEGHVQSVAGTTSLLPLPAQAGDAFAIEFRFDSEEPDLSADPGVGGYPLLAFSVSIAGSTLDFPAGGIQVDTDGAFNLWGVSACLLPCGEAPLDEARLNFYFPPDTIASDALTDPPGAAGTTSVQFGMFSNGLPDPGEASLDATLESLTFVPEPAGALSLCAGVAVLAAVRRWRGARSIQARSR